MKKFRIVTETVTHNVYEVEAISEKEARTLYYIGDETLVDSYHPNWPDQQEPEIVLVEEVL
jgi:hypothetical protein